MCHHGYATILRAPKLRLYPQLFLLSALEVFAISRVGGTGDTSTVDSADEKTPFGFIFLTCLRLPFLKQ